MYVETATSILRNDRCFIHTKRKLVLELLLTGELVQSMMSSVLATSWATGRRCIQYMSALFLTRFNMLLLLF